MIKLVLQMHVIIENAQYMELLYCFQKAGVLQAFTLWIFLSEKIIGGVTGGTKG